MSTTLHQGLPAAANVQQSILFAQLQLLRRLEGQREALAQRSPGQSWG